MNAADAAYDAIRSSSADVARIAENTGVKAENIQEVKDHLSNEPHLLDRYVHLGEPVEFRPFDSDMRIADAWARLQAGAIGPQDLSLLKHEAAGAWYMRRHGPGYTAAHEAASAGSRHLWSRRPRGDSIRFTRRGGLVRVVHITGPTHNLLGLRLVTVPATSAIEELEAPGPRQLAAEDVRREVCAGIADADASLGAHFSADLIQFVPSDTGPVSFYRELARAAVCQYAAEQQEPRNAA